jgi:nucleotide-binding universal stress UspA family protein
MKKILVPSDFSEISEKALKFAIDMAKKSDAEITLINSIHFDYFHDFQYATTSLQSMINEVKDSVIEKMDKLIEKYQDEGVVLSGRVETTHLITLIKDLVDEEKFELVVVGTKGCSGLEEVFIGSNTEKIVRHTPCPVIAVPGDYEPRQIGKILIPIDIREIKDSFMRQIGMLQRYYNSRLEFLWIKTPHNIENDDSVREELTQLIRSYGIDNFTFTIIRNIFPADGILIHAYDNDADMIAMATHARRGISHWLSGSLTEDTLNHIQLPVWTFKLNKQEKAIDITSVNEASGKAEYKNIPIPEY